MPRRHAPQGAALLPLPPGDAYSPPMRQMIALALLPLAACAELGITPPGSANVKEAAAPPPVIAPAARPPQGARTADDFDTTSAEDKAAATAAAPSAGEQALGTVVASLGNPADPGFWLETALVSSVTQGRVELGGRSVAVELRPIAGEAGSGARLSLPAMRALEAPLTSLPEITVYRL